MSPDVMSPDVMSPNPVSLDAATKDRMLRAIPALRGFAYSLCRNRDMADDLVQETLMRAIASIASFRQGTNLEAWLITILRNRFNSEYRKAKRAVQELDDQIAETLATPPEQLGWAIASDVQAGLGKLPPEQQRALFLVGASGLSYEEAAEITGWHVGTLKSRVHRARIELAAVMAGEGTRSPSRRAA